MTKATLEWNENQNKHNLSFEVAQYAFADPTRIIAEDLSHSDKKKRYYCFGKINEGVIMVRFTYRKNTIRIYGDWY